MNTIDMKAHSESSAELSANTDNGALTHGIHYHDQSTSFSTQVVEKEVLSFWKGNQIFQKSLENRKNDPEFIFFDGPPFGNGEPHYGHLLTSAKKDAIARYRTMKGYRVERRFGWDCHGLPVELAVEKKLGISGTHEIEKFGIDKFTDACRKSVLECRDAWEEYIERIGRWVDFERDYKTMDTNYMETVLWCFKQLYDKGLIYNDFRVMAYSWACESPVSDFETKMDNSYREKVSKSCTVCFQLKKDAKYREVFHDSDIETFALAWTTTPWTLPSNLALAVSEDIEYALIEKDNRRYIVAAALLNKYPEIGENVVQRIMGNELIGISYEPLFDYFAQEKDEHRNAFRILGADFVTVDDGTGIVHCAPGFGVEDHELCKANDIDVVCPIDSKGRFTSEVYDFSGKHVFDTVDEIIIMLKKSGKWLRTDQYIHNYPHCWRTHTPLIYRALPAWYMRVATLRHMLLENNEKIEWIPSHIKTGIFFNWLKDARDWNISRSRYWGCPIPVWISDDSRYPCIEVYGSINELKQGFTQEEIYNAYGERGITDLHRPAIDRLIKKNPLDPTGQSYLRRVPDVLDCWFESGMMPFAQKHYPFENKEWVESHMPADFVVEYIGQTRGWFYTMIVLSTAILNRAPFANAVCHGVILGNGGQKLSKSLKNYVDPRLAFDEFGADAMRWYMLTSSVMKGQEMEIDSRGVGFANASSRVIKPLWSAFKFFVIYASIDGIYYGIEGAQKAAQFKLSVQNSPSSLDKYIVAKTLIAIANVDKAMEAYDSFAVGGIIEDLLDNLNNWYIRRSREKFWSKMNRDDGCAVKIDAYRTLFFVLSAICMICAPIMPFITEYIYRALNYMADDNQNLSVHLVDFPTYLRNDININNEIGDFNAGLIRDMDSVRDACNAALRLRNNLRIPIRQPLRQVTFIGVIETLSNDKEMQELILDEINVRTWKNLPTNELNYYVNSHLKLNLATLGRRMGKKIQAMIQESKSGNWRLNDDGTVTICDDILNSNEFEIIMDIKEEFKDIGAKLSHHNAIVLLDTEIDDDLRAEGIVRNVIRAIQNQRKIENLEITRWVAAEIFVQNEFVKIIMQFREDIESRTLCKISVNMASNECARRSEISAGMEKECDDKSVDRLKNDRAIEATEGAGDNDDIRVIIRS